MSNIVSGDRRARRSAAVAAPINYAAVDTPDSSDEADGSPSEQASSSEDGSDTIGGAGSSSPVLLCFWSNPKLKCNSTFCDTHMHLALMYEQA